MTTTTLPNVITAGMRERIAADIQPLRANCREGRRLRDAWCAAVESHVPGAIYHSMQAYFFHKRGVTRGEACGVCGWYGSD